MENAALANAIGKRVEVAGAGPGVLRFYGLHKVKETARCGVELDEPVGKNNGTVGGHKYFECADKHGALVDPGKVTLIGESGGGGGGGDTAAPPPATLDPAFEAAVGKPVRVKDLGAGILRFYGPHKTKGGLRCGVELFQALGKNNGTVGGNVYFTCEAKFGSLCDPGKVQIVKLDPKLVAAVGSKVNVLEVGDGVLRYYGPHKVKDGVRCGVELDEEKGKNNGTVGGLVYFTCADKHGALVDPGKVKILDAAAAGDQAASDKKAAADKAAASDKAASDKAASDKKAAADKAAAAAPAKSKPAKSKAPVEKKAKLTASGEDWTIWYHNAEKKDSETMVLADNGKAKSGKFLIRPKSTKADKQGNDWILTVIYKGKATHHALDRKKAGDIIRFNKTNSEAKTLGGLVEFLRSKNKKWPVPLTEGVENPDNMQDRAASPEPPKAEEKAKPAPGKLKAMAAWNDNLEPEEDEEKPTSPVPRAASPPPGKGVAGAFQQAVFREEAEKANLVERMQTEKRGAAPLYSQGSVKRFEGHVRTHNAKDVEKVAHAEAMATFSAAGEHYGSQIERQNEAAANKRAAAQQAAREKAAQDRADAEQKFLTDIASTKKAEYEAAHTELENRVGFSGLNLKKTSTGTDTISRRKEKYGTHAMIGNMADMFADDE